jgi:hypothetical protein
MSEATIWHQVLLPTNHASYILVARNFEWSYGLSKVNVLTSRCMLLQYGWYPYPSIHGFPYICEKPQILYACDQNTPPPLPPVQLCKCNAMRWKQLTFHVDSPLVFVSHTC